MVTTTRSKVLKPNDEFDTGSESESELNKLNDSANKSQYSSVFDGKSYSPGRYTSFGSTSTPGADRLNQIRSRLSLGASTSKLLYL